ncbi:MAG TPA: hypothetical protein VN036_00525 [Devosia sp.]|nr:hypothetical protein [Devosia sp.]
MAEVVDMEDEPMTLKEACQLIFRDSITPATLRAEADRGRLVIERIGRRDFVTRRAIREMRKLCEVAHNPKVRASGSSPSASVPMESPTNPQSGSSATTDEASVALASALLIVSELSKPSPRTLRASTSRKQAATVIPLKR